MLCMLCKPLSWGVLEAAGTVSAYRGWEWDQASRGEGNGVQREAEVRSLRGRRTKERVGSSKKLELCSHAFSHY